MLTPIKAIRKKCLDCCCGQVSEVRECSLKDCSLYPYRMGHRPTKETDNDNFIDENETIEKSIDSL